MDGRTARRNRSRDAVLDAALALFTEGNLYPTPEQVAERSGVSLRSVYRLMAHREEIVRAAIARHLKKVGPLLTVADVGRGELGDRIERLVDARIRLHDAVKATARAAVARSASDPAVAEQVARARLRMRRQVARHFAPELRALPSDRRDMIAAAVDVLTQLDSIDYLRHGRNLSAARTHATLVSAVTELLDAS